MGLAELLEKHKRAIVNKWFDAVVHTYPADTARFLKSQKDPFANPVGRTTFKGLDGTYDQLRGEMHTETLAATLDPIIRIRAIQDFTPSQAAGFVFLLKNIIRETVGDQLREKEGLEELTALDARVDTIGLLAFDIYMRCREKVLQLKANEIRNRVFSAFHRAGLVADTPEDGPETHKTIE